MNVKELLGVARTQIGTKASNIKKCKYNNWFYGTVVSGAAFDWCAVFVCWVFNQLDALNMIFGKNANCGYMAAAFKKAGQLVYNKDFSTLRASQLKAGDVVFFHWSGTKSTYCSGVYSCDHVGLIEAVNKDGTITTIEGNTGATYNGEVLRRVRSLSVVSCVGRPKYEGSDIKPMPAKNPSIIYRVRAGGRWYKEVNDLISYAGEIGVPITDIAIKATEGKVKYRVHVLGGDWLDYVTGYNINDGENGYAGDLKPIDAIEIYYSTPASVVKKVGYLRAKYRVAPVNGAYFEWQYDDEKDNNQDGYAGEFGKKIDRVQITLSK